MNIAIIGTGYVGLVTGTCFADLGNNVICVDNNLEKIKLLKKRIMPIYEPGLEDLVARNVTEKRLLFTTDIKDAIKKSDIIFIAVSTPQKNDGEADLTYVENVARQIAQSITSYKLIVEKSTVPVQTGEWIKHTINVYNKKKIEFDVASNPEFLREGSAIWDFMHPDRIVVGVESKKAEALMNSLYKPLNAPIIITDIKSAELIKHASNSFLATKISFINAVSAICEKVGADIECVAKGMGLDKRIGQMFLNAGCGYGGSCFPKDINAFIHISEKIGYDFSILKAVREINEFQKISLVKKIKDSLWILKDKKIAVLGLAFKPNTDDMRSASSIDIINSLALEGAKIKAFDPQAMSVAKKVFENIDIEFAKGPYEAIKGADCLVVLTEWNEFKELDFAKVKKLLKQPLIIDGRNIYDPKNLKKLGFKYISVGRQKLA